MIPIDAIEILSPFVPGAPWDDVRLSIRMMGRPRRVSIGAVYPASVKAVTAHPSAAALRQIGLSLDDEVILDPAFAEDLQTAAGLALLGHEMVHQKQFDSVANFEAAYAEEAARTPADQPWVNRFEAPAYQTEARIYCELVDRGFPPGSWIPLGVDVFGC